MGGTGCRSQERVSASVGSPSEAVMLQEPGQAQACGRDAPPPQLSPRRPVPYTSKRAHTPPSYPNTSCSRKVKKKNVYKRPVKNVPSQKLEGAWVSTSWEQDYPTVAFPWWNITQQAKPAHS